MTNDGHGVRGGRGVSRRTVLKGLGAGAVAAAVGPAIAGAESKEKSVKAKTMGAGAHTYELVENWGALPDNVKYGNTHGVCEDSQGRIYVHNQSPTGHSMVVFDGDGKYITAWGEEYVSGAHGLQLSKEGGDEYLYLALTGQHRCVKTTLTGEVVWEIKCPMDSKVYEKEDQYVPTNIAIAPNGDFYVADGYGLSYIHQYNKNAEYIRTWGGKGSEAGKMNCPHGIWIDTRGAKPEIVVADRANVRLQYFDLEGNHLRFVTNDLLHPCHFDQRGTDLLVPDLFGRVTIFDKDNKLVCHLGEVPDANKMEGWPNIPHEKRVPGKFTSPHGAIWDHDGNVYVGEWIPDGRVTKLRRVS
ncbi:MAG: hypothetical protein K1Y02_16495 [Candidatus Hydrogenedentes bacterium]|nr:hypothetical protein [Candidatus Hydrogenedentota bacterium]